MLLLFSGMYNSLINVGVFMKRLFTILLLLSAVCFAGQYVLAGDPPPTGSGTGSSGTGSGSGNGGSNGGSNGGDSLVDITIGGNQTPGGGGFGGGSFGGGSFGGGFGGGSTGGGGASGGW